jgi:hypothetical protein
MVLEVRAMYRSHFIPLCVALLVTALSGTASAQISSKPLSNTGGYAAQEMARLNRSAIGTGYSGGEINRITEMSLRARVPNAGQSSTSRLSLGASGGGALANKPFSNYSAAPTVSPYLNLFRDDFDGNDDFNYQTLVRPQLEQQRFNEQVQRQAMDINRRLQSMSAQPDFNPQGNRNVMPTGHQTVFMNYGHYYPTTGGGGRGRR